MSATSPISAFAPEAAARSRYVVIAVEARDDDAPVIMATRGLLDAFAEVFQEYNRETVGPFEIVDDVDVRLLYAMDNFRTGGAMNGPADFAYAAARAALGDQEALLRLAERQTVYGREMYALGAEHAPTAPGSAAETGGAVEEL